jgi:hypothetical protein
MTPDFRAGLLKAAEIASIRTHDDCTCGRCDEGRYIALQIRALAAMKEETNAAPQAPAGPSAVEELRTPYWIRSDQTIDVVDPDVALRHAEELDRLRGPGSPHARLTYLIGELRKRFPAAHNVFGSDPCEPKYLAAIDRLREELSDHRTMHGDTVGQLQHKLSEAKGLLRDIDKAWREKAPLSWQPDGHLELLQRVKELLNDH